MNGAESLVRTLVAGGVDVCFTNPGTSEMHFVAALDRVEGMRCVLGLFEGVVTGAADGYFRMKGTPASTLLHLGPGLANGLANLHNAKKANSGIVNIVGQHATYHIGYNAPLTSDIEGLARPMSAWVRTSPDAKSVAADGAAAIAAARSAPPQIATLILPADTAWNEADGIAQVPAESQRASYSVAGRRPCRQGAARRRRADAAAADRQRAHRAGAGAGGADRRQDRLQGDGPDLQSADGARQGPVRDRPHPLRDRAGAADPEGLQEHRAGRGQRSRGVLRLSEQAEHAEARGLRGASHDLGRRKFGGRAGGAGWRAWRQAGRLPSRRRWSNSAKPTGALTHASIAQAIAMAIPENAIVVDESITTGRGFFPPTAAAAPHDWLQNMGGSIGFSTPVATGAAVACPDRKVICMVGDGSAMYTLQSLWTQAREGLNVVTIVFANRIYQILRGEFDGVGAGEPGQRALGHAEDRPPDHRLRRARQGHGRAGPRGRQCRRFQQGAGGSHRRAGAAADRSADVSRRPSTARPSWGGGVMQTELNKVVSRASRVLRARSFPARQGSRRARADPPAGGAVSKSSSRAGRSIANTTGSASARCGCRTGTIISTDDHLGKSIYPDIVVHQREIPNNLLGDRGRARRPIISRSSTTSTSCGR